MGEVPESPRDRLLAAPCGTEESSRGFRLRPPVTHDPMSEAMNDNDQNARIRGRMRVINSTTPKRLNSPAFQDAAPKISTEFGHCPQVGASANEGGAGGDCD